MTRETEADRKARLEDLRRWASEDAYRLANGALLPVGDVRFLLSEVERLEARADQYERDAREWMEQRDAARAEAEQLRRELKREVNLAIESSHDAAIRHEGDLAAALAREAKLREALERAHRVWMLPEGHTCTSSNSICAALTEGGES